MSLEETARTGAGELIMMQTPEMRAVDYPLYQTEAQIGRRALGQHRANQWPAIASSQGRRRRPDFTPAIGLRFWPEIDRWCRERERKDIVRAAPTNLTGERPWNKNGAGFQAKRLQSSHQVNERHAAAQLRTHAVRGKKRLVLAMKTVKPCRHFASHLRTRPNH